MTYQVFHAKDQTDESGRVVGIRGRFGFDPTTFPDDFRLVAEVIAPAVGAVFELTNHIDQPWPNNVGVYVTRGVNRRTLRSTSVGDVIGTSAGYFAVAPIGFLQLASLDENFQTRVPGLYE